MEPSFGNLQLLTRCRCTTASPGTCSRACWAPIFALRLRWAGDKWELVSKHFVMGPNPSHIPAKLIQRIIFSSTQIKSSKELPTALSVETCRGGELCGKLNVRCSFQTTADMPDTDCRLCGVRFSQQPSQPKLAPEEQAVLSHNQYGEQLWFGFAVSAYQLIH